VKLRRRILNFDCIILYFNNLDRIERKNEKKEKGKKKKNLSGVPTFPHFTGIYLLIPSHRRGEPNFEIRSNKKVKGARSGAGRGSEPFFEKVRTAICMRLVIRRRS